MKNTALWISVCLLVPLFGLRAQPLVNREAEEPTLRLAWAPDLNGGVGGDSWKGFEVGYGVRTHPLDQFVLAWAHANQDDSSYEQVMLSIEEYWPLSACLVPYGVAGLGYRWWDLASGANMDSTGWLGKIGVGVMLHLSEKCSLYVEAAYTASDRELWQKGDGTDSVNWTGLAGVRFRF